jgi:branched-chain amino acid transport system ATP-binding protein
MGKLTVYGMDVGYLHRTVLTGVAFVVPSGQVVGLIGRNGSGKSTLLRSLAGLCPVHRGRVWIDETEIGASWPAWRRARFGLRYLPQGHRVFTNLTVGEHYALSRVVPAPRSEVVLKNGRWMIPELKAASLSGGERQMLGLECILTYGAQIVLLDEPTVGLAPTLVEGLVERVRYLASRGAAILIAEHNFSALLAACDSVLGVCQGKLEVIGKSDDLTEAALATFLAT